MKLRQLLPLASACLLAGCGSSTSESPQSKQAAIRSGLQRLRVELSAERRRLGPNVLGVIVLTKPPKGVSQAEWQAALRKDAPVERLLNAP